eukprot:365252-Chlamydomonas_euryale.AAC.14
MVKALRHRYFHREVKTPHVQEVLTFKHRQQDGGRAQERHVLCVMRGERHPRCNAAELLLCCNLPLNCHSMSTEFVIMGGAKHVTVVQAPLWLWPGELPEGTVPSRMR